MWVDAFKITPATLRNRQDLDGASQKVVSLRTSVDIPSKVTGITGVLRLSIPNHEPPCVHYVTGDANYCIPVFHRDTRFSRSNNENQPDAALLSSVRRWIAANKAIIVNFAAYGDLWRADEQDAFLAGLVPIGVPLTPGMRVSRSPSRR
ncbi:MAG: hypothetical protein K8S54_10485 [Spirochaetia bacterium]|nr:hypothetical protein [Spirochaetia bacterium]